MPEPLRWPVGLADLLPVFVGIRAALAQPAPPRSKSFANVRHVSSITCGDDLLKHGRVRACAYDFYWYPPAPGEAGEAPEADRNDLVGRSREHTLDRRARAVAREASSRAFGSPPGP